jgi:hypothetical protein
MALPSSAPITLSAIQNEWNSSSLSEAAGKAGVSANMLAFLGKNNAGNFLATSTQYWTVPAGVNYIKVLCVGGGGGGGGGTQRVNNTGPYSGGGGGQGGNLAWTALAVNPGSQWYLGVGAGGSGGNLRDGGYSAGYSGSNGQASFFQNVGNSGIYCFGNTGGGGGSSINSGNASAGTIYGSDIGTSVGRGGGSVATGATLYATSPYTNQDQWGGGYGAAGWNINTTVGTTTPWSIGGLGLYGLGNAYCYLYDVYDGYTGQYIGQAGTNAPTNTATRTAATGSGYGAGGAGGGRDNEYWGNSVQHGAAGASGCVFIWWGY